MSSYKTFTLDDGTTTVHWMDMLDVSRCNTLKEVLGKLGLKSCAPLTVTGAMHITFVGTSIEIKGTFTNGK